MNHVFVVEGFCGFPFRQNRVPPKSIRSARDLIQGTAGPSQMLNFVIPVIASFPQTQWHYYPQFMVPQIAWTIRGMQKKKGFLEENRLILVGFSYGGSAVHAVSHLFRDPIFELVVTLDPVGKWRISTKPKNAEAYGFRKAKSAKRWVNLYQRTDQCSFRTPHGAVTKAIWGGSVREADRETELFSEDFVPERIYNNGTSTHGIRDTGFFAEQAHLWLPAQNEVLRQIHEEFSLLGTNR